MAQRCAEPGCSVTHIVKLHRDGKHYCWCHLPGNKNRAKKASALGGRKSVETRRRAKTKATLTLSVDGSSASALQALVDMAQFLGTDLKCTDRWRVKLVTEILIAVYRISKPNSDKPELPADIEDIIEKLKEFLNKQPTGA